MALTAAVLHFSVAAFAQAEAWPEHFDDIAHGGEGLQLPIYRSMIEFIRGARTAAGKIAAVKSVQKVLACILDGGATLWGSNTRMWL